MEQASEASRRFQDLKRQILDRVDLSREVPDEEMQELIDDVVLSFGREQHLALNEKCRLNNDGFKEI